MVEAVSFLIAIIIVVALGKAWLDTLAPRYEKDRNVANISNQTIMDAIKQNRWTDEMRDYFTAAGHPLISGPTTVQRPPNLYDMLSMRMRWGDTPNPFHHCNPVRVDDKVVVFIIHNKQPTYIEDEWGMYPSDALVTKLRLMIG